MTSARATAVWVDARSAIVVRWSAGVLESRHFESQVPTHHRSTMGVSAPGGERHGGTGPRSAGESHRLEHLRAFLAEVRAALPDDDLLLVGDGVVVERLAASVLEDDAVHGRSRRVELRRQARPTEPQLQAALVSFAGSPPRRQRPRATRGSPA